MKRFDREEDQVPCISLSVTSFKFGVVATVDMEFESADIRDEDFENNSNPDLMRGIIKALEMDLADDPTARFLGDFFFNTGVDADEQVH